MIEYPNFIEKYKDYTDEQLDKEFHYNIDEIVIAKAIISNAISEDEIADIDKFEDIPGNYMIVDTADAESVRDALYDVIIEEFQEEVRCNYSLELYRAYLDVDQLIEDKIFDASLEDYFAVVYVDFLNYTYAVIAR